MCCRQPQPRHGDFNRVTPLPSDPLKIDLVYDRIVQPGFRASHSPTLPPGTGRAAFFGGTNGLFSAAAITPSRGPSCRSRVWENDSDPPSRSVDPFYKFVTLMQSEFTILLIWISHFLWHAACSWKCRLRFFLEDMQQ
jgi:hypothetical protein